MKKFKVLWKSKVESYVWIEAESEKEALEKHSEGDYDYSKVEEIDCGYEDSWVVDSK